MSTRGVIARPWGDGFEGRYHHWDSYPTGLGETLWGLFHGRYGGDLDRMQTELIDEHPAGWSTINNADWSQTPGFVDSQDFDCTLCGAHMSRHYRQYYRDGEPLPDPSLCSPVNDVLVLGHPAERPAPKPERPQCYCHGARSEAQDQMVRSNEDDCGTEWAYVLTPAGLMVCERRWNEDGGHMVGMFGFGASAEMGTWLPLGLYDWDGDEPDWAALEQSQAA
jgi:hypothetical protein